MKIEEIISKYEKHDFVKINENFYEIKIKNSEKWAYICKISDKKIYIMSSSRFDKRYLHFVSNNIIMKNILSELYFVKISDNGFYSKLSVCYIANGVKSYEKYSLDIFDYTSFNCFNLENFTPNQFIEEFTL